MDYTTDYPELTFYAVSPGVVQTDGAIEKLDEMGFDAVTFVDTLELPAATFLWLTARNAEFLSGRSVIRIACFISTSTDRLTYRYVEAPWDLGEVLAKKDIIIKENLLVTKLAGPPKST